MLPNIAPEGLQEAKRTLMLKYNNAPKNPLLAPLKRLTPLARIGATFNEEEDSENEESISQLLNGENHINESHQETDSAALWEDIDDAGVSTCIVLITY
jgi:hypothetical protein